ncbi:uncharacterized protein TNCV_4093141 [Trichonephila clavipes]|nr:uncharacterized protein TNCV_4093141 [Trichonephila clavipes]
MAENCDLKPRCLKCGKEHPTRQCPIKERQENPFYINCQEYGHSACYTKCPKFPKPKKGTPLTANKTFESNVRREGVSFANIVSGTAPPPPPPQSTRGWERPGSDLHITVDHSNLLTTARDSRDNRYINERLSQKSHLPGSVPLDYLAFCVRGKFCHLAQGNRGLIVVKGLDQRIIFEKLGLFSINLEILPYFRDLNDRTLPDHLYDEVYEDYDISECTMVKSYRFARYLQHFNKLQAECKKQTAHLVESYVKAITSKCLVGSLVDRDRLNAYPGYKDCGLSLREFGQRVGRCDADL